MESSSTQTQISVHHLWTPGTDVSCEIQLLCREVVIHLRSLSGGSAAGVGAPTHPMGGVPSHHSLPLNNTT